MQRPAAPPGWGCPRSGPVSGGRRQGPPGTGARVPSGHSDQGRRVGRGWRGRCGPPAGRAGADNVPALEGHRRGEEGGAWAYRYKYTYIRRSAAPESFRKSCGGQQLVDSMELNKDFSPRRREAAAVRLRFVAALKGRQDTQSGAGLGRLQVLRCPANFPALPPEAIARQIFAKLHRPRAQRWFRIRNRPVACPAYPVALPCDSH